MAQWVEEEVEEVEEATAVVMQAEGEELVMEQQEVELLEGVWPVEEQEDNAV
jgi:hypothetical protein